MLRQQFEIIPLVTEASTVSERKYNRKPESDQPTNNHSYRDIGTSHSSSAACP